MSRQHQQDNRQFLSQSGLMPVAVVGGMGNRTGGDAQKVFGKYFTSEDNIILINKTPAVLSGHSKYTLISEIAALDVNDKIRKAFIDGLRTEMTTLVGKASIAVFPCNTVHSMPDVLALGMELGIEILHLPNATSKYIQETFKDSEHHKKVGILATPTTIKEKLYEQNLSGFTVIYPAGNKEEGDLKNVWDGIMAVKAANDEKAKELFLNAAAKLVQKGAQIIVGGCTEVPIVVGQTDFDNDSRFKGKNIRFVSSTEAAAIAAKDYLGNGDKSVYAECVKQIDPVMAATIAAQSAGRSTSFPIPITPKKQHSHDTSSSGSSPDSTDSTGADGHFRESVRILRKHACATHEKCVQIDVGFAKNDSNTCDDKNAFLQNLKELLEEKFKIKESSRPLQIILDKSKSSLTILPPEKVTARNDKGQRLKEVEKYLEETLHIYCTEPTRSRDSSPDSGRKGSGSSDDAKTSMAAPLPPSPTAQSRYSNSILASSSSPSFADRERQPAASHEGELADTRANNLQGKENWISRLFHGRIKISSHSAPATGQGRSVSN